MRIFILIVVLLLISSCHPNLVKTGNPQQLEKVGSMQAYIYRYQGHTTVFVIHGRQARYIIQVDSMHVIPNKRELTINDYYRK